MSDAIYINDNNVSTRHARREHNLPEENATILNSTIDLRWNVTYNATPLTYTQIIEYAKTGTGNYTKFPADLRAALRASTAT